MSLFNNTMPVDTLDVILIPSGWARKRRPEPSPVSPARRLAPGPDLPCQNLTRVMVWPDSRCMLAVMAITDHNQTTSESALACVLGIIMNLILLSIVPQDEL